jgi:Bacterial EndoU nuclease
VPTLHFWDVPGNPRPISQEYPQLNSSGEIVTTGSLASTTTPPGWGQNNGGITIDTIAPFSYLTNIVNPLAKDPWLTEITSERINHSNLGDFTKATPADIRIARSNGTLALGKKLTGGGHGQDNIDELIRRNITFNITKTYPNGVRVGNVSHTNPLKKSGENQSWFPKEWTADDIEAAGKFVADYNGGTDRFPNGKIIYANYKGVRTSIIVNHDPTYKGGIGSVFPDARKQP